MPHDAPRNLGDGLRLRWSRPADTEPIATLVGSIFRDAEDAPPSQDERAYVYALMSGTHPLISPGDFALVEEQRAGRIVACSCLLRQTWRYGDVAFSVGRPELVATDPAYRRRGLIRAIFAALHARSAERGDLVQGITGIPYFYRQFGYEYALDLHGQRTVYFADVPPAAGGAEACGLRDATADDIPFLADRYAATHARSPVSAVIPRDYWRDRVTRPPTSNADWRLLVMTEPAGAAVGYLQARPFRVGPLLQVRQAELAPGQNWRAVALSVLRTLRNRASSWPAFRPLDAPTGADFALGRAHPWYEALGEALALHRRPPYAWYVRVADLPRFLLRIAPVLEARLADSIVAGYGGELRLEFYRGGLRLRFAHGQLVEAGEWERPAWSDRVYAAFPPLVFLQLLFGRRSLDELRAAYPDVWCHEDVEPLLTALFPRQPSDVLPLD